MENTKISWTHTVLSDGRVIPGMTFNSWIGCTRVSTGCIHCFAERENNQRHWVEKWGVGVPRHRTSDSYRAKPYAWNKQAKEGGYRIKVFCGSLMDIFDREVPDEWRRELWQTQHETPYLDWLNLTKRIENARDMIPTIWLDEGLPSNIWMGVSGENDFYFDERLWHLNQIPARIKFISAEPLLGPIIIRETAVWMTIGLKSKPYPDWVIFGGESGPGFRPMDMQWLADGVAQCKAANIPVYVKQDSGLYPGQQGRIPDDLWNLKEFPE